MIGLYEYDNATKHECDEDLVELIDSMSIYDDNETLIRKGLRLQYIAQRLQELGE